MKLRIFPVLGVAALVLALSACTDSDDTSSTSSTTKITSFSLANDSVDGLSDTEWTIDNDSNVIYNVDSLPYLSRVDSLIPTIYGSTLSAIYINDTITYSGSDTIDCTNPVRIVTVATDEVSTRTYTLKVNVHQVDPDLYHWKGLKSEIYSGISSVVEQKALYFNSVLNLFVKTNSEIHLYTSEDGVVWSHSTITGLPLNVDLSSVIVSGDVLLTVFEGELYKSYNATSWSKAEAFSETITKLLFSMNDKVYALGVVASDRVIFESADCVIWQNLGVVPAQFPVSDFSAWVDFAPSGKARAYIVGGVNTLGNLLGTVWSTENGSYWANLAAEKEWFTPRKGVSVIQYSTGLIVFGGQDASGTVSDKQWMSPDYGLTWNEPTEKSEIPDLCIPRAFQSVVVDDENYIYIIGGKTSVTFISDVWRGRKNSSIPGFLD